MNNPTAAACGSGSTKSFTLCTYNTLETQIRSTTLTRSSNVVTSLQLPEITRKSLQMDSSFDSLLGNDKNDDTSSNPLFSDVESTGMANKRRMMYELQYDTSIPDCDKVTAGIEICDNEPENLVGSVSSNDHQAKRQRLFDKQNIGSRNGRYQRRNSFVTILPFPGL